MSAVRWSQDQAVEEILAVGRFDEDDLYAALEELARLQTEIGSRLYRHYMKRRRQAPVLFLYDVTSSYLEGDHNELAVYGYNRDGKVGKKQMVIGLLSDDQGEPMALRVFAGNTVDPTTLPEQIKILKQQFRVEQVVLVGDRGMVKSRPSSS